VQYKNIVTDLDNFFPRRLLTDTENLPGFLLGHGLASPSNTIYSFLSSSSFVCIYRKNQKQLNGFQKKYGTWIM
jgi:hypothetical protein